MGLYGHDFLNFLKISRGTIYGGECFVLWKILPYMAGVAGFCWI